MIPQGSLAARYLDRLLAHDQEGALLLVREALQAGLSVGVLYLEVFEAVQHEIGRLWERNRISVAQEHYCTAVTQLAMTEAYPRLIRPKASPMRIVLSCVPGELHELGGRMVADFFEMDGWDALYLGEPRQLADVLDALQHAQAQLLGISVTMSFHLPAAAELIAMVRARPDLASVKILVGGRAVAVDQTSHALLRADDYAAHVEQAPSVGRALIAG